MKKRCCLAILVLVISVLFLPFTFSGPSDNWAECSSDLPAHPAKYTIGEKIGSDCCAGTSASKGWTTSPLAENLYSCADSLDNDCDVNTDCADTDCNSRVCGTQTRTCTLDENPSCDLATGDIYADTGTDKTCNRLCASGACGSCTPVCDRYVKADCTNTCSG